ncbi:baseplate J/gp47 family protein [Priestia megaterium]
MATNDLSNKEEIVQTYMKELLRNEFPNLDISDYGAFMEMFGLPHIKLLTPLIEHADRNKLKQSLDNASLMTEEEMDVLASRFFMFREPGEYSTGYVTLKFDDVPANGVIQVRAGTQAESKQGYRFRSTETVILDENDLAAYYDPDTFRFLVPVKFESENTGAKYNVNENDITSLVTPLPHLAEVSNEIAFKDGKDKETNEDFANRIKERGGTPNLGVERGWITFAKSFPEVKDVTVAGMGHPLMQRDIIGVTPPGRFSSAVNPNVHWGGKIDLHIRGFQLEEFADTKQLTKTKDNELIIPLSKHPTYDIVEITFSSPRYTDPDLDETFFVVRDFLLLKHEDPETIGTLSEDSWVVVKDSRLNEEDTVTVRYRFNKLFETMNDALYTADNRPPASDVLLKEARKKYVHASMIMKLQNVTGIQLKDKSVIRQRLFRWINDLQTGEEIQFSDLAEPIYQFGDDSVDTKVDYISLPSQFLVTDYDNRFLYYCLNEEKRNFIKAIQEESVYFKKWIPYYRDNVTIYDFFDAMHLLTYQNIEKGVWQNISFRDHTWGKKVQYFNIAKRMLAYVNSIQRLSPARWTTPANQYFELGNFTINEDITYTEKEVEDLIDLYENIANPGEEETNVENILHFLVYVSVMLYITNTDNLGGLKPKDLFDWLIDLTKSTPIDYQVHH